MESEPQVPSQKEMAEKLKYAAVVTPPPESDWPTMTKVQKEYPSLCSEEQGWILEALISEAHRKRREGEA